MNANDAETLKDTDFAPKYKKKVINIEENVKTDTNYKQHKDNSVILSTDAKNVQYGHVGNNAVIWLI